MKKLTHEEFVSKMYILRPNIIFNSKYINAKTLIDCQCLIDDFKWKMTPDRLLHGGNCPICSNNVLNKEILIYRLQKISPHIKVIGKYINNSTKILCLCTKHNTMFYMTPTHLLRGQGCKYCKKEKISNVTSYSQNDFENKFYAMFKDFYLVVGKYIDSHTSVDIKCCKCNKIFSIIPNNAFSRGIRCPDCYKKKNTSKGEKIISTYLDLHSVKYEAQKQFDGLYGVNDGLLSYDFYLSEYNLLIEFQGEQHEHVVDYFGGETHFKIQQEHDRRKREYAKAHNIELLEIWYYDIDNIKQILECRLLKQSA